MKVVLLGLTVGAAVSRLEAPAVAPAGNPSCCSACKESPFIEHLFTILSIFTSRERVARLPGAGGVVEVLGGPEIQDY